jgi:hypothetical protein
LCNKIDLTPGELGFAQFLKDGFEHLRFGHLRIGNQRGVES